MLTNMVGALNNALELILKENDKAVILGEDVGKDGGVFRVTDGLQDKFGSGQGYGHAACGIRNNRRIDRHGDRRHAPDTPRYSSRDSCSIGFDQLINHAARYRSRTRSRFTVPMIVRTPVSGGVRTLEHHSDSPEAYYSHIGGLIVVEPSNPYDAKGLLIRAAHLDDPVVFLEPTKLYRLFKQEIPEESYEVPIGKANIVSEGDKLTIITYGTMVPLVKDVVSKKGVSAEIIDLRTINPMDERHNNRKREEDRQGL